MGFFYIHIIDIYCYIFFIALKYELSLTDIRVMEVLSHVCNVCY